MIPISASGDAYRTVTVTGHFLSNRRTLVRAVSDAGAGYWVLTPLDTGRFVVLVNRGFILPERKDMLSDPVGPVHITGLLRITEPGGGFLRANDPVADRWFSRDVGAIVTRRRIANAAPYFIDADAASTITGGPQGGLTVIRFPDNHLAYAITWFGMALLCLWALWRLGTSP
jgi:surfeit locus 1 family protein